MTFPFLAREQAVLMNRGHGYSASGVTGTMAAALAQDSLVFAMRCDAQNSFVFDKNRLRSYLDTLRLDFTTIGAFTTPITPARRLAVYRAAGPAATGGAALTAVMKDTALGASLATPASIVTDVRIATTDALGVAGITREAAPIATLHLAHVGAAGGRVEATYAFATPQTVPPALNPGELLVVSNPVAMDAAGTWQLGVTAEWYEQVRIE